MDLNLHTEKPLLSLTALVCGLSILLLSSCGGNKVNEKSNQDLSIDSSSLILKYDNTLFALPSPYQASAIIKSNSLPYNSELPNPASRVSNYNSNFKKGYNLGIYGTDLSYFNIYDKSQECITYFAAVKRLSDELGISSYFDDNFFKNIETNIGNQDSLLYLTSYTYRNADMFLKRDDRSEISAMVLAGGWVESVFLLCQLATTTKDREIINRIGEQKYPLDNLIDILSPHYYVSPEYSELVDDLVDLAYEFDGIIFNYYYKPPKVDPKNKLITINSESQVVLSEYQLEVITKKLTAIRNKAVQ